MVVTLNFIGSSSAVKGGVISRVSTTTCVVVIECIITGTTIHGISSCFGFDDIIAVTGINSIITGTWGNIIITCCGAYAYSFSFCGIYYNRITTITRNNCWYGCCRNCYTAEIPVFIIRIYKLNCISVSPFTFNNFNIVIC